jgi:hypothetical protein
MKSRGFVRPRKDYAEISELESVPLAKEDGKKIAFAAFGCERFPAHSHAPEEITIQYRTVIRPGTCTHKYPGILFDPPLFLNELLCVSVNCHDEFGDRTLFWREFPRVTDPTAETRPRAIATGRQIHHLSDPLMFALATAVFGRECVADIPLTRGGTVGGTLEFSLVLLSGQPGDCDLDPPLVRGEVIEIVLSVPQPNAPARRGKRAPLCLADPPVASVRYPRVTLPLGEHALAEFLTQSPIEWLSSHRV